METTANNEDLKQNLIENFETYIQNIKDLNLDLPIDPVMFSDFASKYLTVVRLNQDFVTLLREQKKKFNRIPSATNPSHLLFIPS